VTSLRGSPINFLTRIAFYLTNTAGYISCAYNAVRESYDTVEYPASTIRSTRVDINSELKVTRLVPCDINKFTSLKRKTPAEGELDSPSDSSAGYKIWRHAWPGFTKPRLGNALLWTRAHRKSFWGRSAEASFKKLPTFYGTRRWITVFRRARDWSLSWTRWIQPTPSHSISLRSILKLSSHLNLGLPCGSLH